MAQESDYSGGGQGDLSQFRKNRFFSGKLMTPRDMEAEQEYHAERLHTLARSVIGRGIVHGLEVRSIDETDDGLDVTIEPGMALDGHGRPIVVDGVTTTSLPRPSATELSLYIQYDEVTLEPVPVPNTDDAIDDESTANRTAEVFELTYREGSNDGRTQWPDVDIPDIETDDADTASLSHLLLERYHDRDRSSTQSDSETKTDVFLGTFERTPDAGWTEAEDTAPREYVYDHDLLFGTIIDHITDTDNPHRTPAEREPPDIPDDLTAVSERLDALEADIERVERDQDALTRYVMRKTLTDRARFFDALADRLEHRSSEGVASRLARDIAAAARPIGDQYTSEDAYRRHVQETLEQLIDLGDRLEGVTTEASLERYLRSVSDLQETLEDDGSVLALAETQDRVCEAADALEVLVDVVPDE
ncbi:hypothetical protein ACFR99_16450 [Haloarchaeobius amylolyticus]|uniref:Uncharacterized protein n=1 Tax=Haloarchaeobius amylolyticus TaxID=1198296 RepID=A0ABD6BKB7_9EURY